MRGYPKVLSSKEDYLYVKDNFPADLWKADWQGLLDTMTCWYPTGEVASVEAGVTDDTHKVEKFEEEGKDTVFMQYELRQNPDCKLLRLGFTEAEVKKALGIK